jgi:hypothetical protein
MAFTLSYAAFMATAIAAVIAVQKERSRRLRIRENRRTRLLIQALRTAQH